MNLYEILFRKYEYIIFTRVLQNKQGPDPSWSHTIRPHERQLLISLCLDASQSHLCLPKIQNLINIFFINIKNVCIKPFNWIISLDFPSAEYNPTNFVFLFLLSFCFK